MTGREEDAGLAGKVAIVSGGGAAGDGIGNGRAAAILLARAGTKVVVSDLDKRLAQRTVETMFLLSKHAIPAMIKTAKGGAIVNISSISALRPRGLTTYTASKAAVIGLTQAMAVDHGKDHIRVNCICPGPMYTPMVNRGNGMTEANRAQRAQASVLKIEGTGWDIGQGVRFLMSAHARYITGQVLVVDGGVTLQGPERDSQDH